MLLLIFTIDYICHLCLSQITRSYSYYRQTSNIESTIAGNKIVDHSDVVGASPVGAAPIPAFNILHKITARRDEKYSSFGICCILYSRFDGNLNTSNVVYLARGYQSSRW